MYVTNELHARKAFKYILWCSEFRFKLSHVLCLAFLIYTFFICLICTEDLKHCFNTIVREFEENSTKQRWYSYLYFCVNIFII